MAPLEDPNYWLSRIAKTRARLYWLTMAFAALVFCLLSVVVILGEAIEPIAKWPADLVGFFAPGLPANLVQIAMTYPVLGLLLVAIAVLIVWTGRRIRIEEGECAFRSWASHRPDSCKCSSKDWKPELLARAVARIGPVLTLLAIMLAAISVGLLMAIIYFVLCSTSAEAAPPGRAEGTGTAVGTSHREGRTELLVGFARSRARTRRSPSDASSAQFSNVRMIGYSDQGYLEVEASVSPPPGPDNFAGGW